MRLFVKIRTFVIQTICAFQEKAAILGPAVRRMQESSIKHELVDSEDGERGLALSSIVDVGREAQALILALERLLLIYGYRQDASILAEVFIAAQSLFLGHVW